jgi:hypothetical protein
MRCGGWSGVRWRKISLLASSPERTTAAKASDPSRSHATRWYDRPCPSGGALASRVTCRVQPSPGEVVQTFPSPPT